MIISVSEFRKFVEANETDEILQAMLDGIESFIKKYTNNDFVNRESGEPEFPADIKMGVINLIRWDIGNREKIGLSSETLSRHSVTYSGVSGTDSIGGYPAALIGFLKPYIRARF